MFLLKSETSKNSMYCSFFVCNFFSQIMLYCHSAANTKQLSAQLGLDDKLFQQFAVSHFILRISEITTLSPLSKTYVHRKSQNESTFFLNGDKQMCFGILFLEIFAKQLILLNLEQAASLYLRNKFFMLARISLQLLKYTKVKIVHMHLVGFTDLNISANTHVLILFDQNIWSFLMLCT